MTTFSDAPWDGSASRWPDSASYCKSCLIDLNPPGKDKVQALCKLPYREPSGAVNKNALAAALAAINGARGGLKGVSPDLKAAALRKLKALYLQSKLAPKEKDLPESLKNW